MSPSPSPTPTSWSPTRSPPPIPKLGEKIPEDVGDRLVKITESDLLLTVVRVSEDVRFFGVLLPLLALLCLAGSIAVAADRRQALLVASSGVAIAAVIGFFLFLIARAIVLSQFDDETVHLAVAAVWEAFFGGLRAWILGLGFIAILLAAAAAMARERDPLVPARRALACATRTPETSLGRAGRAVAVGAVEPALRPSADAGACRSSRSWPAPTASSSRPASCSA